VLLPPPAGCVKSKGEVLFSLIKHSKFLSEVSTLPYRYNDCLMSLSTYEADKFVVNIRAGCWCADFQVRLVAHVTSRFGRVLRSGSLWKRVDMTFNGRSEHYKSFVLQVYFILRVP